MSFDTYQWMAGQIEEKVEEVISGTPPADIKGSTTIRLAVSLITGKWCTKETFTEREAWEMLDEVQRHVVAKHRPKSKFAKWWNAEQAAEAKLPKLKAVE